MTPNKSYRARIEIDGKAHHIGTFKTEHQAREAYKKAVKQHLKIQL
jgi:hypothetical protein